MLSRRFTPLHMLFLSINGIIGSAWLFAPLYSAKIAGASAVISWLLGGGATILIALTFAEISTMLPVAGGTTRFAQMTQGTTVGFMISWASWLSCVTMPPIEVQAVLQYSSIYMPSLVHVVNSVPVLSHFGLWMATIIMFILCVANIASFRGFVGVNFFIFTFKVVVIMLTIILLLTTRFHWLNFTVTAAEISGNHWQAILSAVATGGIAFAFTGFKHGVELAGETQHSQVAIPLAIVGSVVACLLLYLGLQIAFIGALDSHALLQGWQHLSFTHDAGPFVGLALMLGLVWLVKLLLVDAAVSPLGAALIYVTSTARIIYAMSKNHYISQFFARVDKNHFPVAAIFLNFVVGMFLFLPLPGWQNMVSFLVSAVVISYAMGPLSLQVLRRHIPDAKRPFKLPAAKWISIGAFYCCNLISYWTGWDTLWKLAIALLVGGVIFLIAILRQPKQALGLRALYWLVPYLVGLVTISYLGSYGGGLGVIGFGWDFFVIALFSLIIYNLALHFSLDRAAIECSLKEYEMELNQGQHVVNQGGDPVYQ